MRILATTLKVWLSFTFITMLMIWLALMLVPDINIVLDDQVLRLGDGNGHATGAFALAALAIGLIVSLTLALVGVVIPLIVMAVCLALLLALGGTSLAILVTLLCAGLPILIPVAVCALLVRALSRPRQRVY